MNTNEAKPRRDPTADLAFVSRDIPGVPGMLRVELEDFRVHEVPAYEPEGTGDHLFVHIEKRDLTTKEAVRRLAKATDTSDREAGFAGMKDRRGVTRQWISLHDVEEAAREQLLSDPPEGIEVLAATPHGQKLRTGHLKGNRFVLRVRHDAAPDLGAVRETLAIVDARGLPNYFGSQRFGRFGDNAEVAMRWLRGEMRAPRDKWKRKLLASALQSDIFNRLVSERVADGTLSRIAPGELVKKHETGGLFVVQDDPSEVESAQTRADAWELSPTGPMFGTKMRRAEHAAWERELGALEAYGLTLDDLTKLKKSGAGTRRLVRVRPEEVTLDPTDDGYSLAFTLPKGSYATAFMREIMKCSPDAARLNPVANDLRQT